VVTGTGRRAKTTYEERTTEQSTIHEGTVIWQGSRKDISGFEFSDQTVKVVNMEAEDLLTGEKPTYVFTDEAEIIFGTNESDVIDAGGGNDLIIGGGGDDDITGGAGSDILLGGEGNDILRDKYDDDVDLAGMISDDIMIGGAGVDTIDTGGGNDIVATGILDLDGDDQFTNADVDIMAQIQPDNDLINQLYNLTEDDNAYS
ncbi:hypothetical protein N9413_12215, partial [Paracoccaceae bacterium]|nr:hypothetical protein [Paracoccaceae bacterium]